MYIFGKINFWAKRAPRGAAAIMNLGCSPGQKHGGFFLVILDIIPSKWAKFQLVINLFQVKPSYDWTIIRKNLKLVLYFFVLYTKLLLKIYFKCEGYRTLFIEAIYHLLSFRANSFNVQLRSL